MRENINKEMKNINRKLEEWIKGDEECINFYGRPFQSNTIFSEIISKIVRKDKKILYIYGKEEVDAKLIDKINLGKEKKVLYTRNGLSDVDIAFMSFKYTYNITKYYDLIIIDDISTYFKVNKESLEGLYKKCKEHTRKIIIYSIETNSISNNGNDVSRFKMKNRFVEPRVITTRIDLKKDIPNSLYEYILWFKERKSKVVFWVPYYDEIESLYYYYVNEIKLEGVKIFKSEEYKNDLNTENKAIFIITNSMEELGGFEKLDGIIALFADNIKVDYKKIIYMCGKVTRNNDIMAEVILVSRTETDEMDRARSLTRKFNKKLWDEEYLKI
ncbi:MAG: hypothetical protein ACRDDY_16885 [Clostridium sp.]|uniref:hypothetical protein n=1 Tax=Clostridium sp. TaxID=1506 RepID=UPI003EE77C0B